jgi:ferredoxin-type protein NapG
MPEPLQPATASAPQDPARRRFLGDGARLAGTAVVFGVGLGLYARGGRATAAQVLRPPGALAEARFLGACVRCGLCVRDCPYGTLRLAVPADGAALGTPLFSARSVPCEMCEDIPCVRACPTGALDPKLRDITAARMGLAVLLDQENCLNFNGLRCDVCYRVCPLIDSAITLDLQRNARTGRHALFVPVVHSQHCTGCGKCERSCVLDEAAIKVLPVALARGAPGAHYRMGWEEKERAGRALVEPDAEHRFNLPEGQHYEYGGQGLLPPAEAP